MNYQDVRDFYLSRGFGGRVGFGRQPAVIVIDMAASWMNTDSPLGSDNVAGVMDPILRILEAARAGAVPIFFTTMAFDAGGTELAGPVGRKLRHCSEQGSLVRGSARTELDPRLERRPDEPLIEKQRASAFWGTPLQSYLIARGVDTLILTGCSTSGCVRGTAESGHNEGYHTIVAREAVADRSAIAHECNLVDIDMRYADVEPTDSVVDYLRSLRGGQAAPAARVA